MKRNEPILVCALARWTSSACGDEGFFKESEGKPYCVLHYPGRDKGDAFHSALIKKLEAKDFNFSGVSFPDTMNFEGFRFSGDASFSGATFHGNAYFGQVVFDGTAEFYKTTFLKNVYFHRTAFGGTANFYKATFHMQAYFGEITLTACARFRSAVFKDYVRFVGSEGTKDLGTQASLDLQFAHVEKPDHFSLHTLRLQPHWFVNIDARRFEFIDVEWFGRGLKDELSGLSERVTGGHRLLAIAYRQLAVNAEENHRYREASRFRYDAFQASRMERFGGVVPWRLDWWYWLASGYGESIGRALLVFIALIAFFAVAYTRVGFEIVRGLQGAPIMANASETSVTPSPDGRGRPLGPTEAAIYSAYVTILQKPEPKPLTSSAKALVWMEMVLGPTQAALLLLAVRRKFMR